MKRLPVSAMLLVLLLILALTSCTPCLAGCETPAEYRLQSNCPYTSACIDGACVVACPVDFATNATCAADAECDCTARGERTLNCVCHDGRCLSVEERLSAPNE